MAIGSSENQHFLPLLKSALVIFPPIQSCYLLAHIYKDAQEGSLSTPLEYKSEWRRILIKSCLDVHLAVELAEFLGGEIDIIIVI